MQICVVTGNDDKFEEISSILQEFGIEPFKEAVDFLEDGKSLEEIAGKKALQAFSVLQKPLIVDDTGVFFEAIHDFPGIYARRVYEEIGYAGLLKSIENKPKGAFFKTVVCFTDGAVTRTFDGFCHGHIVESVVDENRPQFPYEKIFVPQVHEKRMCDFTLEEKIKISHRAIAVRKFCEFFVNDYLRKGGN